MAGHGKSKKKKNKGKSNNSHKSNKKKDGTLNPYLDLHKKNIEEECSREKEYECESESESECECQCECENNESPHSGSYCVYSRLEEILCKKVELIYMKEKEKLELGFGFNGPTFLNNIFLNALQMIINKRKEDGSFLESIYENDYELAGFSVETMVSIMIKNEPNMTRKDAILSLLQFDVKDSDYFRDNKECCNNTLMKIEKLLKESSKCLQALSIGSTRSSSLSSKQDIDTCESSSPGEPFVSDQFDFLKVFIKCPDDESVEDWLKTCSEDLKENILFNLDLETEKLTKQVKERREWAEKIVLQTANKFSSLRTELRDQRLDKLERLLEENEFIKVCSLINEKEKKFNKLMTELASEIEVKRIFELKNHVLKSTFTAYDLTKTGNDESISVARKKERKALKKCDDIEKKVGDLKGQIEAEKQKLIEAHEQMEQVKEAQEQLEMRQRQEKEAKTMVRKILIEQKRLHEVEKINSKQRLAAVRHELDMNYRRMTDENSKLEHDLSQLKAAQNSSTESSSSTVASSSNPRSKNSISRRCKICSNNDVQILFLPCAHQVICSDCNEEFFFVLENHCPCCKVQIVNRFKVYGPGN